MLTNLLAGYPPSAAGAISLATALALAYLVADLVGRLARAVFIRFLRADDRSRPPAADVGRRPLRIIRITVFSLVFLVLFFPALKVAGVHTQVGFEPEAVVSWLFASGLRIAIIIALAVLVVRATTSGVKKIEDEISRGQSLDARERAKRVNTLGTLVENVVGTFAFSSALLMILRELNVDVVPLLTGAGIVGLAIGFGAQTLVKDVISGFFIILENQLRVGDISVINGTGGTVESIRLRTITLRDIEGTVHVFPNGSITKLANKSKDYSYAMLDVDVPYKEDTDRVVAILKQVGEELQKDPAFSRTILDPLQVFGIEAFHDSRTTIRVRLKTLPLGSGDIAREMRRRIKKAFDANGIEMNVVSPPLQLIYSDPPSAGERTGQGREAPSNDAPAAE